jgi:hypothetical protein
MVDKKLEWLANRIQFIKTLKNPNEQQQLIVLISEKINRSSNDEKMLSVLVRAEKAAEKASIARSKASALMSEEKKNTAKKERKNRDHELYKSAGLLIMAGLVDTKTGKPNIDTESLLGALASLAELSKENPKWQEWKKRGDDLFKKTTSN